MHRQKYIRSVSLVLLLVFAGFFYQPGLAKSQSDKEFQKAMDGFRVMYKTGLEECRIVGSSFMFIHDNKILAKEFYGMANIDQNRKTDENTIYHWASITKTFAGIGIMQLRDRGLLKLDDPVIQYIPELKIVHNPFGDMSEITIRHLMTHSAGFRGATWPWPWHDKDTKKWQPHEPLHWDQLVAMFPYTEVAFKPGSRVSYSNLGIIFLGRIVDLLTTDDWECYIDKNIFKPLGMHRSYFDTTPYHLMKDKGQSYFLKESEIVPAHPDINTGITVSNGGLKCPFPDFVQYVNFLMGDPAKQHLYDVVLKRSTLEEMWTPQYGMKAASQEGSIQSGMGLTFFIEENNGMKFIWHSGGQNAWVTLFMVQPESRTAFILAYNTTLYRPFKPDPDFKPTEETMKLRNFRMKVKQYVIEKIIPLFSDKK